MFWLVSLLNGTEFGHPRHSVGKRHIDNEYSLSILFGVQEAQFTAFRHLVTVPSPLAAPSQEHQESTHPFLVTVWPKLLDYRTFVSGINVCDPKCLLRRPETSKLPKVVWRGCRRCFGVCGPKPIRLVQRRVALVQRQCCIGARDSWETLSAVGKKHLWHPLLTTSGNFEVSGLCSRHSRSQINVAIALSFAAKMSAEILCLTLHHILTATLSLQLLMC